jgi:hypothetical protein
MSANDEKDRVFTDFADLTIDGERSNVVMYNWQPITEDFLSACKRNSPF